MPAIPQFRFSHHFPGSIWNTLAVPENHILIIEVRDDKNFQVQFFALNFLTNKFIWENVKLKESWWIGLTAVNTQTLLFHTFVNRGNPDHKNLTAFDIFDQKIRWEIGEFSFFDWNDKEILGYRTTNELVQATINIESGAITDGKWEAQPMDNQTESSKPIQYFEGTLNFETVKKFMNQKTQYQITKGVEYLECKEWIIISAYVEGEKGLANYLLVFNTEGEVLLEEKLGENLPGLGSDTFFMLSGCLFLVKNKSELVAYTFYD